MNKWLRRTVGTVGIASGIWLLGSGAAHADASTPANDPQHLSGLLDGLFTPAGGPNNLGLTLTTPHDPVADSVAGASGSIGGAVPELLNALPITDVLPLRDLGGLAAPQPATEGLPLAGSLPALASAVPLAGAGPSPAEALPSPARGVPPPARPVPSRSEEHPPQLQAP